MSKKLRDEIKQMRLPITTLERIELEEFLLGSFDKEERRGGWRMIASQEISPDGLDEIRATKGSSISQGMRMLYMIDAATNNRDLTNYYLN